MSTKKKVDKGHLIKVRVTEEEKLLWQARANYFTKGNLSKFIRAAANNYRTKNKRG